MATKLKLVIVGDGAAGKNYFFKTWLTGVFPSEYKPVVFEDYSASTVVDGEAVSLSLHVTNGQEDYDRLRPLCYPGTDVLLVAFNINNTDSLYHVKNKWIPEITHHCPNTPWLLLGLQADHRASRGICVSQQAGQDMAKLLGAAGYRECSALTRHGLNEAMEAAVRIGLNIFKRKTFRELYKKAMTKGYVETSVTKCLILGAAGVGKTHFKHLFLNMGPPQQRVSTGLADNPVRAISFTLAGVGEQEEDDLFVIENDQSLMGVIGKVITNGDISMAPSLAKMVSSHPKMPKIPSSSHIKQASTSAGVKIPAPKETYQTKQPKIVDVREEMAHHIHLSSENKKLFGVKFIQFTDCGGQLQYHDILPLFIQDPIVTIFALNLSEELSHHPTIEYYGADGRPVSRPYHSSLSHKQILQHCLGAIHSRDTHPMIAIVGTHKDTEERCSESQVLPQTVFCDPQVVLSKVNELVEYHHKLRDCPQEGVAVESDLINFRDHGMVSVELLRKFPKHYIEGLFTPQDLMKLLLSLGAIVVIRDDEYLMPALLPHLDPDQVAQYREHGAPLMIRFSQGYIPSGLFCNFIALLFSFSWKVCMDRRKPSCLHRNCIRLEQSGTSNIMTLIDMFSYIEVHVREASYRVRREIRGYVTCGIKSACSVLKYHDVQLEDSFSCCGDLCSSDPLHLATVVTSRGSEYKWKCTLVGDQMGDLSEDQYPDLGILLLEDDNGVLVDSLTSEHQRNTEEITRAILQRWIAGTGRKPTTWMTLADVLRQCQLTVQADAIQACFL
eukprot:Em0004g1702a